MIPKILEPYWDRLEFIREMLDSPLQEMVQEAYDLLFDLWLTYFSDSSFNEELQKTANKHSALTQQITDRLNNSYHTETEKAVLLKSIILLYPFEVLRGNQKTAKYSEKVLLASVPKIFLSYSHKDESFKNDLIVMLAGLQRRGVLDVWQDRRIEAGSNWFYAIQKAMEECDMALLLISSDFIASSFIQTEELTRLFRRRIEEGLRVVPVIVRPCLWGNEPVIKDLQALPKDGRPVISFSKENGDRDQVWADIGIAIESIAKNL